jgi:phage terminase small subunit
MSADKHRLTPKQASFVREYLLDKNATRAAIRAGYSPKTAGQIGEENLKKPEIRQAIDAALADLATRVGVTAEMVMAERRRLAFFDPRKLFNADGSPKAINELDADTAAAIAGLDVLEEFEGSGKDRLFVGYTKKYKVADKNASLAALERHFGLGEKAIRFQLPEIKTPADCAGAQSKVLVAVATGQLLPGEGETLSGLIERQRQAFETADIAERLAALEERFPLRP